MIGHWDESPIGPMIDVMWARPDGTRVLLADRAETAAFVGAVYQFDEVQVVPFRVSRGADRLDLVAGPLEVSLRAGAGWRLPPLAVRPPWVTRLVERPIAQMAMGVRTFGTTPSGVREWYRAIEWRPVRVGAASLDEVSLGALGPLRPRLRVGFSEPPRQPSMVLVRPMLEDPQGGLDEVLRRLRPSVPAR